MNFIILFMTPLIPQHIGTTNKGGISGNNAYHNFDNLQHDVLLLEINYMLVHRWHNKYSHKETHNNNCVAFDSFFSHFILCPVIQNYRYTFINH